MSARWSITSPGKRGVAVVFMVMRLAAVRPGLRGGKRALGWTWMWTHRHGASPGPVPHGRPSARWSAGDRKSTRLNSSHLVISYAVFCLKKKIATGFVNKDGSFTLVYVQLIFQNPDLVRGLRNATGIAVGPTALTLLVTLPLAGLGVRYPSPGRGLLAGLLLVPLVLPPFVGALGLRLVLGRFGPLTQLAGVPALGIYFF